MSDSNDRGGTVTLPVTESLRDRIRLEKAKRGVTYDELLRAELSIGDLEREN